MKKLCELTPEDILNSDYNTLISIVEETNRAPGGYQSVQQIANACFLDKTKKVLEIGTSTGNTAIELARMTGCQIESIDINERSVQKTAQRISEENLEKYIHVSQMDATALRFEDHTFDVVFCGNVTSLIPDKEKALSEYIRVLKPGGMLAAVPMYYVKRPSEELLEKVSAAIHLDVQDSTEQQWLDFYNKPEMVLKYRIRYDFDYITDEQLKSFVNQILSRPHLKELSKEAFDTLCKQYEAYIYLFRDNLSNMGYSILLYSKEIYNNEPELFTAHRVNDVDGKPDCL